MMLFVWFSIAQKKTPYKAQWQFPAKDTSMKVTLNQQKELLASEEDMTWFKDAKLGIFVHWGPALLETDVLSWGRFGDRPGAGKAATDGVDPEVYDNLYKLFNPVNFDADKWMQHVKDFGASYLVFTAKHHDGFCFFDAKNTDFDIMNTPYGKDICKQLANAAHKAGIKIFWYYSQPDWHHPDCLRENHYENYLPYMKEHVNQLFTDYGRIDGVFWDHLATKYWQWDSYHVLKQLKIEQPGLLSNSRVGFGWPDDSLRGDYENPEQSLGPINHPRYWEACLTMTDKWLYHKNGPIKPSETILGMLIQVIGNGGNLLLNFGPNGEGEFVKEEAEQGYKVGAFLKQYGHTLYNTRKGLLMGGDWGASTQKGNILYLHFIEKVSDNSQAIFELPELPTEIITVTGITDGFIGYEINNNKLIIKFDKNKYNNHLDNIVALELKENPKNYDRIETWEAKPVSSLEFNASSSSFSKEKNNPDIIYGNKGNVFSEGIHLKSWWEPEKNDQAPWLQLDFKTPKNLKTILLSENMRSHSLRKFSIETKDINGNWKKVYTGQTIGEGLRIKLNGNSIRAIRFNVLESIYTTQITAFNVYE
ncbi:alpha-L-fucosidase [Aestuariibaculum suncheonense]|nr:alpha-L-fucosidase [Aestuariibaculum suncheonense]